MHIAAYELRHRYIIIVLLTQERLSFALILLSDLVRLGRRASGEQSEGNKFNLIFTLYLHHRYTTIAIARTLFLIITN